MKQLLRLVLVACVALTAAKAQPTNDEINNAINLGSETPLRVPYTSVGANPINLGFEVLGFAFQNLGTEFNPNLVSYSRITDGGFLVGGPGAFYSSNIWFRWTAPESGDLILATLFNRTNTGRIFDTTLVVFERATVNGEFALIFKTSDDDSGFNLASALTMSVVAGREYFIAAGSFANTTGTATLGLRFNRFGAGSDVPQLPDNFDDAFEIESKVYTVLGSNTLASSEPDEPNHANANGTKSVWFKFTAPYHGSFKIDTEGSLFNTALALYEGNEDDPDLNTVETLTQIGRNINITAAANWSRISNVPGRQGQTYYIAVDGNEGASGVVRFNFKFLPAAPGFDISPQDQTEVQGSEAIFAAVTRTTDASIMLDDPDLDPGITYLWERLPAGSKTWSPLTESATYVGVDTETLTVTGLTLGMNRDSFRLTATDVHGTSSSRPATLYVTAFEPLVTRIGGVVDIDLTDGVAPPPGTRFMAKRLPKGLTLNRDTGEVTGSAIGKAKPGTYVVEYWSIGPDGRSDTLRLSVVVGEFLPKKSKPIFEALMVSQPSLLPFGRVVVNLTDSGTYSALIEGVQGERYSLRGAFRFNNGLEVADATHFISRGAGQNRYRLNLTFTPETRLMTAVLDEVDAGDVVVTTVADADSFAEVRTAKGSAAWTGLYTLGMADPTDLGVNPAPEGAINATGDVHRKNTRLNLRGHLGDGTAFTSSLLSGVDASYRLFVRPSVGGYLAGWMDLVERPQNLVTDPSGNPGLFHVTDTASQDIYWERYVGGSGAYAAGFGPVALRANLEPWRFNRSQAFRTGIFLGTYPTGDVGIVIRGAGLDNSGGNPDNLPTLGNLNLQNQFSVVGDNSAGLTLSLDNRTGAFTGSFNANGGRVTFRGVFIQQSAADNTGVVARGVFNLPGSNSEAGLIELTLPQ